jgi:hypothetical protein
MLNFNSITIFNCSIFFLISLISNVFLFSLIYLGVGGSYLKLQTSRLIEGKSFLLTIVPFLTSLLLFLYLNNNLIYLDVENVKT